MTMQRTVDSIREELISEIEKSRRILDGLENNEAYKELVSDFKRASDEIDAVWHLQPDLQKLQEMRITKFAADSLIKALDTYKMALERATQQLARLNEEE